MKETKKVLITNDDPTGVLFLSSFLDFYQQKKDNLVINSFPTYSGFEAVNTVKRIPDLDLVIMNWEMPQMNGIQTTNMIKKIRPNLPVILYSAHVDSPAHLPLIEEVFDSYIPTPVLFNQFCKVLDNYLIKK